MADLWSGKRKKERAMTELAEGLLHKEGDDVVVVGKNDELLSDEQMDALLDRSDEAMRRKEGWTSQQQKTATAFEVFTTQKGDDTNDTLARMIQVDP